jgi:formyltetrahydrofolate deformylase
MSNDKITVIALIVGPDRPGLVAEVSGWIFQHGGNILHADQHHDREQHIFFQRIEWECLSGSAAEQAKEFEEFSKIKLGVNAKVALSNHRPKVAIFVSKFSHCFHDIILRWKSGELNCDIPMVISNHKELREASDLYGIPFYYFPISNVNRREQETAEIQLLNENRIELVVMARYMQILSDYFIENTVPVINVHHSFLPAFPGGKPYHQAYTRGVKLIGASAHYATKDLDEGPIIAQDVTPISHRHSVEDLIRRGRDLEKRVFAQAIRWHIENRILVYGNKTVVFD